MEDAAVEPYWLAAAAIAAELANPSCCEAAAALAEFNVFLSLALRLLNQTCTRASVNLVLEENERLQFKSFSCQRNIEYIK